MRKYSHDEHKVMFGLIQIIFMETMYLHLLVFLI